MGACHAGMQEHTVERVHRVFVNLKPIARVVDGIGDHVVAGQLEGILHPAILERAHQMMDEAEAEGADIFIAVVPLLYESGSESDADLVVLIDTPLDQRISRMVASRDLDEEEARRIAAAQMPAEEKRKRADLIIENDADLATLNGRVEQAWKEIQKRAGKK